MDRSIKLASLVLLFLTVGLISYTTYTNYQMQLKTKEEQISYLSQSYDLMQKNAVVYCEYQKDLANFDYRLLSAPRTQQKASQLLGEIISGRGKALDIHLKLMDIYSQLSHQIGPNPKRENLPIRTPTIEEVVIRTCGIPDHNDSINPTTRLSIQREV